MAGKNKTERGFRIYFDDMATARDITDSLIEGSVTIGRTVARVDMTGVDDVMRHFLAGYQDAPVSAKFYLDDTATTGAWTVLDGMIGSVGTLTLQFGSDGATPTTGDPEWEGEYRLVDVPISTEGGRIVITATWVVGTSTAPAWGTVS